MIVPQGIPTTNLNGWDSPQIGDICAFKYGASLKPSSRIPGDVRVYGSNGVVGSHNEALVSGPTIIVGRKGSIGKVHYSDGPCWPIDTTYYVDDIRDDVSLPWLRLCLEHCGLDSLNKAAAVPGLNRDDAYRLQIPLPPLDIQKKIAAVLDKADSIRRKRKQVLSKLDELLQSVFLDMFGDPVTNPKGWEVKKLGDVVVNLDSRRVPIKQSDRDLRSGPYPYYGASGIIDHIDDFIYDGRNLLIGEDGANLLARSTPIAFIVEGQYWVNNHAHVLGAKEGLELDYLARFINSIDISSYVFGAAQPKLTRKSLDSIPVPIPPLEKQKEFVAAQDRISGIASLLNAALRSGDSLFNSLLQRAFKGELEFNDEAFP